MKRVHLFLASSIVEFENVRNEIGDVIRKMQDVLIDYGFKLQLFECEFYDNKISFLGRKQEEYNEFVRGSDLFLMLVGTRLGEYTLEEFKIAKRNCPCIQVFFLDGKKDDSVLAFEQLVRDDYDVYSDSFSSNLDLMKKLVLRIACLIEGIKIDVNDDFIVIKGEKIYI